MTTINTKSKGITLFEQMQDWHIILIGDQKTPQIESSDNLTFLSINDQQELGYQLVEVCPYNHYTRKNIGYLYAIQQGADIIYDSDDDNSPYNHWEQPDFACNAKYVSNQIYVNIYRYFSEEKIWPRGFPLDEILIPANTHIEKTPFVKVGVWQGLVNGDPDVDAIFRLTENKKIEFKAKPSVVLEKEYYCPFNSQNTFWNKKAFPFLYLPAKVSFRFTDILRGYIAQRLLWENDLHLGFMKAIVYQERNIHDLIRDFEEEIECYLNIKPIVNLLNSVNLKKDPLSNIETIYQTLLEHGFVKQEELKTLRSWIADLSKINNERNE